MLTLVVAAVVFGVGPGTLRDALRGLTFVRPRGGSIALPALHADSVLQARLVALADAAAAPGRVSAAIVDLQNGASATINAKDRFEAASLFKLPILLEVLSAEDDGRLDADERLLIRPEDWTDGSGVLQARVGESLSVRELTRLMIQESDNIAALVLLDRVGVPNVNATAERLGLRDTHVVDHRAGEPGEHMTSADDMVRLLVGLATGQLAVSRQVADEALSLLELKQSVNWLGEGLPFWVKVAHKWGDLPRARNDVGLVFTPRGSYAVAVLTEGAGAEDSASAIARISRLGYDYLSEP